MTPREPLALIRDLPKVELHLHVEGSARRETVRRLALEREPDSALSRERWWEGDFWTFRDLSGFARDFHRVNSVTLRSADDYYCLTLEALEDLAAQHVVYVELSVGLRFPLRAYYVSPEETLQAMDAARAAAERRWPIRAGIIAGLGRYLTTVDQSSATSGDHALDYVQRVIRVRDAGARVMGIDLHGDEQSSWQVTAHAPAFRRAAAAGLGLRAHAGEGAGPESVWAAVRELGVTRIAHGVRAAQDPELVRYLAARRVALDMCLTSNARTGAIASLEAHPLRALDAAGIPVTLSSDDPVVFGPSVTDELMLAHERLGCSMAELARFQLNAARYSFLPPAERLILAETLRAAWEPVSTPRRS